jgi:hypothetical protein
MRVGVFSLEDDLHALAVQHRLRERYGAVCHVVETNALACAGGLTWSVTSGRELPVLRARDGAWFDVRELDVIWWRRASYPQRALPPDLDADAAELVAVEWRSALLGLVANEFTGRAVNNPARVRESENKLIQLRCAARAGLRVPRTLVSQDPAAVRRFCQEHDGGVIVKAVRGLPRQPLMTVPIDLSSTDDEAIRLCPAIYQESVPGRRHLRICCFGDRVHAVALESDDLDWRRHVNGVPFYPFALDETIQDRLRDVLRRMDIRMAIMDAKLTPEGELVWLEANPQGQFLFLEGLSGVDLTTPFCEFLLEEGRA